MSELFEAISACPSAIVIVDDSAEDPRVELSGGDKASLYHLLEGDPRKRAEISELVGGPEETDTTALLRAIESKIDSLYETHLTNPISALSELFDQHRSLARSRRARVDLISDFCVRKFEVRPKVFATLEEAKSSLERCVVAFVDFRLSPEMDECDAIKLHGSFRDSYRGKYDWKGAAWHKVVVLISDYLPGEESLRHFREKVGVRSCFFERVPKDSLTDSVLELRLATWDQRYGAASLLSTYIDSVSESVQESSRQLMLQIDRLETHDLAILNAAKLVAEKESLQSYLTWLIAESLAAKVRSLDREVVLSEGAVDDIPLEGKIRPDSSLFELFAEIASAPVLEEENTQPLFGDVYKEVVQGETQENARFLDVMLLVISPACDLIRAPATMDILCVRGTVLDKGRAPALIGRDHYVFGKGMQGLRVRGHDGLHLVKWHISDSLGIVTVPRKKLSDKAAYSKVSRVAEIFTQEIKEMVLSKAGRVGVPVEPVAFATANVAVRFRDKDRSHFRDLSDQDFASALITYGRLGNEKSPVPILVFTREFVEWLREEFLAPLLSQGTTSTGIVAGVMDYVTSATPNEWRVAAKRASANAMGGCASRAWTPWTQVLRETWGQSKLWSGRTVDVSSAIYTNAGSVRLNLRPRARFPRRPRRVGLRALRHARGFWQSMGWSRRPIGHRRGRYFWQHIGGQSVVPTFSPWRR